MWTCVFVHSTSTLASALIAKSSLISSSLHVDVFVRMFSVWLLFSSWDICILFPVSLDFWTFKQGGQEKLQGKSRATDSGDLWASESSFSSFCLGHFCLEVDLECFWIALMIVLLISTVQSSAPAQFEALMGRADVAMETDTDSHSSTSPRVDRQHAMALPR